jgi:uncharacterized protein YcfL
MKKFIILAIMSSVLVSCKSIKKIKCDAYSQKNFNDTLLYEDISRDQIESMKKYSSSTTIKL